MKKVLIVFFLVSSMLSSLWAAIVDCGCAYQGGPFYDVEINYQGDGDCCHPFGFGSWSHLDPITNEILSSGHMNGGDAAGACQSVGSLGC